MFYYEAVYGVLRDVAESAFFPDIDSLRAVGNVFKEFFVGEEIVDYDLGFFKSLQAFYRYEPGVSGAGSGPGRAVVVANVKSRRIGFMASFSRRVVSVRIC